MTTNTQVRQANEFDCAELAVTLRTADRRELEAASSAPPLIILLDAIRDSSECWTLLHSGRVMAMWGVVPREDFSLLGRVGSAWLLTSDLVEMFPKTFMSVCMRELSELLDRWDGVFNFIDVRHEKAIRWAERLGFRLADPAPYGEQGLPFQGFWLQKEDLNVSSSSNADRGVYSGKHVCKEEGRRGGGGGGGDQCRACQHTEKPGTAAGSD